MRFEQLEYVEAVTRHGSLRRASEHLHISQPALSESITRLEKELGVTLLERRRTGTRISRRGSELLEHMTAALEAGRRLREAASEEVTATRAVQIGTVQAANSTILVPAIRSYRAEHQQVSIEIRHLQQPEIFADLAGSSLDIGLVNLFEGDDPPAGLTGSELIRGTPVAALPADHPLAARDVITRADLAASSFISMRPGYLMHRFVHRWIGTDARVVGLHADHVADGAELGMSLVAEGLGVTVLPDFTVDGHPHERAGAIVTRPLEGDLPAVILVACQRGGVPHPQPVRDLRRALQHQAALHRGRAVGSAG